MAELISEWGKKKEPIRSDHLTNEKDWDWIWECLHIKIHVCIFVCVCERIYFIFFYIHTAIAFPIREYFRITARVDPDVT